MRVRVLGNLVLESNGVPVSPPRGVVGALLRALLIRPGDVCSVEELCEGLWPGSAADVARPRLHVAVSRLRSFLARHEDSPTSLRVDQEGEGYRLHATPDSLDRLAFEEVAVKALAAGGLDTVDEALALWGGEPYAGFELTAAVRNERSRLTDIHRSLVDVTLSRADAPGGAGGFVRSKFRSPRLYHDSLLPRLSLLESAPDVGEVTLLAVTAPAGFGKSVFLSQWARRQSAPVVWVNLDEEDNDPARFWSGFVGAVAETGCLDLGSSIEGLPAGTAAFFDMVCELLESSGSPLAIVLDDCHVIDNPALLDQAATLLTVVPDSFTIAVGSRAALPVSTARLGASGRLHTVAASDLRFAVDDIELLVGDRSRAEGLWAVTEGWPVAVMALRDTDVSGAQGSPGGLGAYLVEEVLAAVPAEVRRFLLEVAFLDRFNRQLCDAVTGRGDAVEMIAWLQTHQFFVLESGPVGDWFRLHHLVAEELRRRADVEGALEPSIVQRRAAEWFLDQGMREEALRYAIRARERPLIAATAGDVLVESALRLQARACHLWLERIDPDDLAGDVRSHSIATCLASAWGSAERRRSWARNRRRRFGGDDDLVLTHHDAGVAVMEGRASEAVALCRKVIDGAESYGADIAPQLTPVLVGLASGKLIEARMLQDTLRVDDPLLRDSIGLIRSTAPAPATFTLASRALVAFVEGSYELAVALAEEFYEGRRIEDTVRAGTTRETSLVGALATAQTSRGPDDLRGVAEKMKDRVDFHEWQGNHIEVALTRLTIAALYRASGDLVTARKQQRRAETLLQTFPDAPFLERFAASVDDIVAGRFPGAHGLLGRLTPRERVVLAYLTTDLSTERIARALYVSPSTVRSQVSSIYRKLGVSNRHQAVAKVGIDNIDLSPLDESSVLE